MVRRFAPARSTPAGTARRASPAPVGQRGRSLAGVAPPAGRHRSGSGRQRMGGRAPPAASSPVPARPPASVRKARRVAPIAASPSPRSSPRSVGRVGRGSVPPLAAERIIQSFYNRGRPAVPTAACPGRRSVCSKPLPPVHRPLMLAVGPVDQRVSLRLGPIPSMRSSRAGFNITSDPSPRKDDASSAGPRSSWRYGKQRATGMRRAIPSSEARARKSRQCRHARVVVARGAAHTCRMDHSSRARLRPIPCLGCCPPG
jgi:hypothetical protein